MSQGKSSLGTLLSPDGKSTTLKPEVSQPADKSSPRHGKQQAEPHYAVMDGNRKHRSAKKSEA